MKGALLILFLVAKTCCAAVTIEWTSDLQATNKQSDGVTLLDEQFEFILGTFVDFTPDSDNLDKWQAAWRPFGSAVYRPEISLFSNGQSLITNEAPFTTTAQVYIWGRNGLMSGSEWILISKPTWKWPVAETVGPPPFPVRFLVANAAGSDAIFGSVNTDGVHMQTAAVAFDLTYAQWASFEFVEGEAGGADEDFDQDGRSNFLEYAVGSDPRKKDSPFRVALNSALEIEIPRAEGRLVKWVLRKSDDLTAFTEMTEGFEITVDEPTRLVFKITGPVTGKQFFVVEVIAP